MVGFGQGGGGMKKNMALKSGYGIFSYHHNYFNFSFGYFR